MKFYFKRIIAITILPLALISQSIACTAVTLVDAKQHVVSGRTMEWGLDWDWRVIYIPKNTEQSLAAPADLVLPIQTYKSKYSILGTGIKNDHQTILIDGQNDQGLSVSANYLPNFTQYQKVSKNDNKYVSIIEFTTFILSEFANINQVRQALKEYKVWSDSTTMVDGISPELHFLITDKQGEGLVVEYVNGDVKLYDVNSNVKVMTNAPTYDWHLINLKNYLNLSNKTIVKVKISDFVEDNKNKQKTIQDINGLGEGNGFLGLPGDYSPPSRFVKVAILAYYSNNESPALESLVTKIAHILHNVDIAKGTVVEKISDQTMYDHTAYTVIKDLDKNLLYLSSYSNPASSVMIDLNKLDKNNTKAFDTIIKDIKIPNTDITDNFLQSNILKDY
ncbi:choloylglycine hydrolase family protein [Allofrancisella frigidaquae]|uniref:Choloylglycine hydrolase family protein n=1 Tax=Allofrancisella frigidaquae TaxID=1085644 RepID=A0A6M3HTR4_9GAMM|nr:choloylglycine hydrolase family protein [Allofrancisella frigidaquae]KEI35881.1 choloylglycine hydrolase family protein [Francisella sp. W12-1067]QIV94467.1 choloylglycine hydrolase family protein [Allofrancisella frigidaquae]